MNAKHYIVKVTNGEIDRNNETFNQSDIDRVYAGTDYEGAKKLMNEKASKYTAEDGEYYEVSVWEAVMLEGYDEESDDILDYLEDYDYLESVMVDAEYRDLEHAVVIYWTWHRYTGYAREFNEVEIFCGKGTEKMCIPEDKVTARQVSVIAWPEELEGMDTDDKVELITDRIHEMGKWNISRDAIESKVKKIF